MKHGFKKMLGIILCTALAAAAGALSGCGASTPSGGGEVKTVTIWNSNGSSKAFWEGKVEEFNKTIGKQKDINIVYEASTDASYTQRVNIAVMSDTLPDIFDGKAIKDLVEQDRITPLDDLPGMDKLIEKYKPYLRETVNMLNGKTYALIGGITIRGLLYNKEMFKAAGIVDEKGVAKPPVTFAELREDAKKLTDASKMQYGIVFPLKWQSWVDSDITALAMSSSGLPGCYNPQTQQFDYSVIKPIVQTYLGMKADGSIYPGAESLDNDPARARFAEGGIGMKIAYSFDVGVFTSQFPAKFDWGVAPLPVMDANNCYKQNLSYSWGMRVSKKGVERNGADTIAEVMKWWYSDDNYKELYKEGLECCPDYDVIKDVKVDDSKKQWVEFCELQKISTLPPLPLPTDVSGQTTLKEIIINKIWTDGASVDLIDSFTKIKNDGIVKYKEIHPDADYSAYDYKDWKAEKR